MLSCFHSQPRSPQAQASPAVSQVEQSQSSVSDASPHIGSGDSHQSTAAADFIKLPLNERVKVSGSLVVVGFRFFGFLNLYAT